MSDVFIGRLDTPAQKAKIIEQRDRLVEALRDALQYHADYVHSTHDGLEYTPRGAMKAGHALLSEIEGEGK